MYSSKPNSALVPDECGQHLGVVGVGCVVDVDPGDEFEVVGSRAVDRVEHEHPILEAPHPAVADLEPVEVDQVEVADRERVDVDRLRSWSLTEHDLDRAAGLETGCTRRILCGDLVELLGNRRSDPRHLDIELVQPRQGNRLARADHIRDRQQAVVGRSIGQRGDRHRLDDGRGGGGAVARGIVAAGTEPGGPASSSLRPRTPMKIPPATSAPATPATAMFVPRAFAEHHAATTLPTVTIATVTRSAITRQVRRRRQ